MTQLEQTTTDDLVDELKRRSGVCLVYREFVDSEGLKFAIHHQGDPIYLVGLISTRIGPAVYHAARQATPDFLEDT